MEAHERAIGKILTESIRYEVPPYQRPYSWEKDNVQQLLEDMWGAFQREEPEYFIGSLITIERTKDELYDVVDGQQRLTTLNLIFAKFRDHIADAAAKAELAKRILPRNPLTGEEEAPRLLLRTKDRVFFRTHVLDSISVPLEQIDSLDAPKRHLVENLGVIGGFLAKAESELKLFANFILTKVYVVFVNTSSLRSAYRLFNVLNARGLPLSNSDLIKNALFENLKKQHGTPEDLEARWIELEETIGIDRLDVFFGHHRTSIKADRPAGALYEELKPLIQAAPNGPLAFLDNVIASARNYVRISDGDFPDAETLRPLRALNRVDYDEWIPPLLACLNRPVHGLTLPRFASLLEKITMQNWVRRLGRTARLTVYFQLITAIRDGKSASAVQQIFRDNAQNQEFLDLLDGEVYGMPFAKAVLLRLEEASQDESVTKNYSGQITIEHVLPQTPTDPYWNARFNEEEHRAWLNRLGNLALLSGRKNYSAQNFNFARKREIYTERNETVSFDITKGICAEPDWTPNVIAERQRVLMNLAKKLWLIA